MQSNNPNVVSALIFPLSLDINPLSVTILYQGYGSLYSELPCGIILRYTPVCYYDPFRDKDPSPLGKSSLFLSASGARFAVQSSTGFDQSPY